VRTTSPPSLIVTREFRPSCLEFEESRKEGNLTSPQTGASGQSPSNASNYLPQSMNFYRQAFPTMQNPTVTDSSLPEIAPDPGSNPWLQLGVGSRSWMEHGQERQYPLSVTYPYESAGADNVWGQNNNSLLSNEQMTGYTMQDQYTTTAHWYTYPLPQSPADQAAGFPHSPPDQAGQQLALATTLPPLSLTNNPPTNSLLSDITMFFDYRLPSGGGSEDTTGDDPSAGLEYDKLRTS